MKNITHKELIELVKIVYKRKLPLFIHGGIGIGKSSVVKQTAIELSKELSLEFSDLNIEDGKFGFVDVRISQLEPTDLRGLPFVIDNKTKWITPEWLPCKEDSKGILFFDELNLAPPSIQSACYELILDRKLGNYRLPDGWVIISAGNRIEDKANIFEMSAPLLNRFLHIELTTPNIQNWSKWALNNNIDSRIISFLQFKPSYLYKFEANQKDKSFPTPRTYEYASKLIYDVSEDYDLMETLISSAVGHGIALEFTAFCKLQRKINIDDLIKNPVKIKQIKEIDLKYSVLSGVSEKYKSDSKLFNSLLELCKFLEPEFSILLLGFIRSINPSKWKKEIMTNPTWKELSSKYAKYLLD
jgi:hypothetical protein